METKKPALDFSAAGDIELGRRGSLIFSGSLPNHKTHMVSGF
jgi:hypothetical protein